jgi:hypothetical protein
VDKPLKSILLNLAAGYLAGLLALGVLTIVLGLQTSFLAYFVGWSLGYLIILLVRLSFYRRLKSRKSAPKLPNN